MVVGLMGKSLLRGMISMLIGLSLSLVGMDPLTGNLRFTFGVPNLVEGLDFVVISMGLFGISEVMLGMEQAAFAGKLPKVGKLLPNRDEWGPTMKAINQGIQSRRFVEKSRRPVLSQDRTNGNPAKRCGFPW